LPFYALTGNIQIKYCCSLKS